MSTLSYCTCETPIMDVEHDAGCRRCGRPVDFTPEREHDVLMTQAYNMGAEHGRNAAAWYFGPETPRATYLRVLEGLAAGDPATYDSFPSGPLSGEYAGEPLPADVLGWLEIADDDPAADDALRMYEDGFGVAVADEIERLARYHTTDERTYAREAARYFVGKSREDGSEFTTLRDDRPDWVQQLVYDSHDGMLPDDWRYECIYQAVCFVRDCEDWDDRADEFANDMIDTNSADLIDWLGSHSSRAGWVQEARDEFGDAGSDIWDEIARGQLYEARDVFALVTRGLGELL